MEPLWAEENMGTDAVIMHAKVYYATLVTNEALYYVAELEGEPQQRFRKCIKEFISKKHRIPDDP